MTTKTFTTGPVTYISTAPADFAWPTNTGRYRGAEDDPLAGQPRKTDEGIGVNSPPADDQNTDADDSSSDDDKDKS